MDLLNMTSRDQATVLKFGDLLKGAEIGNKTKISAQFSKINQLYAKNPQGHGV